MGTVVAQYPRLQKSDIVVGANVAFLTQQTSKVRFERFEEVTKEQKERPDVVDDIVETGPFGGIFVPFRCVGSKTLIEYLSDQKA